MTKKLKLKDEDAINAKMASAVNVFASRTMAEMAYSPPAQQDAFTLDLTLDEAGRRLLSFFERIERLDEERRALVEDIAEVFAEAKGEGFDVSAMRALLKIRGDDDAEAKLAMLKLYHDRVGMKCWPA